jgi:heme-degrading monooxygenase HmoA
MGDLRPARPPTNLPRNICGPIGLSTQQNTELLTLETSLTKSDNFGIHYSQKEVHVFARIVSMRLKPNMTGEFTQTIEKRVLPILRRQRGFRDEITFIAPGGTEAVGISLWDSREQADAYDSSSYLEVVKELNKVTEGTPQVKTYDVANSTPHNIAARSAA